MIVYRNKKEKKKGKKGDLKDAPVYVLLKHPLVLTFVGFVFTSIIGLVIQQNIDNNNKTVAQRENAINMIVASASDFLATSQNSLDFIMRDSLEGVVSSVKYALLEDLNNSSKQLDKVLWELQIKADFLFNENPEIRAQLIEYRKQIEDLTDKTTYLIVSESEAVNPFSDYQLILSDTITVKEEVEDALEHIYNLLIAKK